MPPGGGDRWQSANAFWMIPRCCRQMPQLVRIAHYVQCSNDVAFNLERRSLHEALGSVHDDTRKSINGRKTQSEVLAPSFARDLDQEPRGAIGAVEHVQCRRHLAAAVRHDAHIACEQLRQGMKIT
jgi:hypothetical protein